MIKHASRPPGWRFISRITLRNSRPAGNTGVSANCQVTTSLAQLCRNGAVERGWPPGLGFLPPSFAHFCSWYSSSTLMSQILLLSTRPVVMLSTAIFAVSMEWSWLL